MFWIFIFSEKKKKIMSHVSISSQYLMYCNGFIKILLILMDLLKFFLFSLTKTEHFTWYYWLIWCLLPWCSLSYIIYTYWFCRIKQIKSAFYSLSKVWFLCLYWLLFCVFSNIVYLKPMFSAYSGCSIVENFIFIIVVIFQ